MKTLTLFLVLLISVCCHVEAPVVCQVPMGRNACGPCAGLNSLIQAKNVRILDSLAGDSGLDKSRSFALHFGASDSSISGIHRTAYSDEHGTADADLSLMVNRLFQNSAAPGVASNYLVREAGETPSDFVMRVQSNFDASIRAGFHPLLSLRAVAAQYDKASESNSWNSMGGHWVAVHGVDAASDDGLSFVIHFSDSLTGEMQTGFVYFNKHRRAKVPMQFTVNSEGREEWNWVSITDALTLVAPGMPLGTRRAQWNERAFITLRYAIFQDAKSR